MLTEEFWYKGGVKFKSNFNFSIEEEISEEARHVFVMCVGVFVIFMVIPEISEFPKAFSCLFFPD